MTALLKRDLVGKLFRRCLTPDALVVGGLGSAGRTWREQAAPHATYYASDPMGAGAMIALGLALARPQGQVFYIGGDGDLVMNLGCLLTIVGSGASNLKMAIFDNRRYETGGEQALAAAGRYSLSEIARNAGFPYSVSVAEAEALEPAIRSFLDQPGLAFMALRVATEASPYGAPPQWSQAEDRAVFMRRLAEEA